ncbi:hypothetical protein ASALC70_03404 [Alcanivorax sp. ALC70]|nr:hypothetical protein ASALC70_03404 [Alcanivorax sp. ALC70]
MKRFIHWFIGGLLVVAFWVALPDDPGRRSTPEFRPDYVRGYDDLDGRWQMRFASDAETPLVHAASMVELPDGRLRAFWFAGKREGGPDVGIHSAVFDPARPAGARRSAWSPANRSAASGVAMCASWATPCRCSTTTAACACSWWR